MNKYWLPYQRAWLNDRSKIKIWDKSRRVGATYVQAFEDVTECFLGETREVWFSSADETAAKEYILYCQKWASVLNIALSLEADRMIDPDKDVKALSLTFNNGARINALTSNPTAFRSKGGKIVIDEFAHHKNPTELWRAASPCVIQGYPIRILSTHNGTDSLYNQFLKDSRTGKLDWSVHSTTLEQATEQGYVEHIVWKILKEEISRKDFIKSVKDLCPDDLTWLQEYCCEPRGNLDLLVCRGWSNDNIIDIPYLPYITNSKNEKEEIDLHITCDFNWSPNCWAVAHVDRENKKTLFFDEFCMDLPTEDLIRVVLDKYPHPSRIIINGDASGDSRRSQSNKTDYKHISNELIKRGYKPDGGDNTTGKRFRFDLRKSNGSRKERFSAWNKGIKDINGNIGIYVDNKCEWLIYNCTELRVVAGTSEYDLPTRGQIKENPKAKYLGHALDDAQYLQNYYFPITKERAKRNTNNNDLMDKWKKGI